MEWVSVSDCLPENGTLVIATNINDNWIEFCVIDNGIWVSSYEWHSFQPSSLNPSHWCYIPQLPEHPKEI